MFEVHTVLSHLSVEVRVYPNIRARTHVRLQSHENTH